MKQEEEEGSDFTKSILQDRDAGIRQPISNEVPQLPPVQSDIHQDHEEVSQSGQN